MRVIAWMFCLPCFLGCSEGQVGSEISSTEQQTKQARPNILLIVADDLGYTDLGAFGGEISTPNLDALAESGIRFTNFHTHAACQPTRAMLMSGLTASKAIKRNPPRADGERANELRADIATLPELLRGAGYETYMAGKWDLGLTDETTPHARGFDRSFVLLEASASHFAEPFWSSTSYYQEDTRRLSLKEIGEDFYSTQAYTEKFLEYLRDHDTSTPWFGYLAYTAPHWPLQVPADWLDRHKGRYDTGYDDLRASRQSGAKKSGVLPPGSDHAAFRPTAQPWATLDAEAQGRYVRAQEIYAAMVDYLDKEIGRVVKHLHEQEQLENTVILFMSDHGSSAAEFGMIDGPSGYPKHFDSLLDTRDNSLDNMGRRNSFIDHGRGFAEAATAPLKLFKGTLSEGGIRAPAFVHYPAVLKRASVNNTFFTAMDVLPTFLELAQDSHPGTTIYNGRQIQAILGRSVWPHLVGESPVVHDENIAIGWSFRGRGALVKGGFKLTNEPDHGRWASNTEANPWRFYNLTSDPGELTDLASEYPDRVSDMYEEWARDWQ